MLAYRRDNIDELNRAAHDLMLRNRRLGHEAVTPGEREFRVRDQVICRRNDTRLGLRNGMRGTVVDLAQEAIMVRDQTGAEQRVPFAYAAEHLDYGYALTGHAAQGVTLDRAFVLLHDEGALQEWGYVACSRARLETRLYLADHDRLERETPLRAPGPAAPPERAARALRRPAAEVLALDQRRQRPDTILNHVAQQQQQLCRNRDRTSAQLAAAERELEHLHWWNRDRRAELETEITFHREALERAGQKYEQLRELAEQRTQRLALAHERDEPRRALRPKLPNRSRAIEIGREPPGLGLEI
jgi:hypothetical protein